MQFQYHLKKYLLVLVGSSPRFEKFEYEICWQTVGPSKSFLKYLVLNRVGQNLTVRFLAKCLVPVLNPGPSRTVLVRGFLIYMIWGLKQLQT